MRWMLSWRADPRARVLADRHYNRQSVGATQFVPPGRCLVLLAEDADALWITSWPIAEYVKHAWPGAWVCSCFRNESEHLSSALIADAVAATCWRYGPAPEQGFVTFVDPGKVRRKRDPGRCFIRAGWVRLGFTKGGLVALGLSCDRMPDPVAPIVPADPQMTLEIAA
jgi:hypothetical protein